MGTYPPGDSDSGTQWRSQRVVFVRFVRFQPVRLFCWPAAQPGAIFAG